MRLILSSANGVDLGKWRMWLSCLEKNVWYVVLGLFRSIFSMHWATYVPFVLFRWHITWSLILCFRSWRMKICCLHRDLSDQQCYNLYTVHNATNVLQLILITHICLVGHMCVRSMSLIIFQLVTPILRDSVTHCAKRYRKSCVHGRFTCSIVIPSRIKEHVLQ